MEIETRGEQNVDKIFFKVKDVMIGFEMDRLNDTLTDIRKDGYKEDIHYKYFKCVRYGGKIKKELFLTYMGFKRLLYVSKHGLSAKSMYIIDKWLTQLFDTQKINNFGIKTKRTKIRRNVGYVYCVTSILIHYLKIGKWCGTIKGLYARYKTYYGKDITIQYVSTKNAFKLERECHKHFENYKITNELYEKEHYEEYIQFLENNKEEINEDEDEENEEEEEEINEECEDEEKDEREIDVLQNIYNKVLNIIDYGDFKNDIYELKLKIISQLLDINIKSIKEVFNTNSHSMPFAYLSLVENKQVILNNDEKMLVMVCQNHLIK